MVGDTAAAEQAPHPPPVAECGAHQQHGAVTRQPLRIHLRRQGRAAARARCQMGLHRPGGDFGSIVPVA